MDSLAALSVHDTAIHVPILAFLLYLVGLGCLFASKRVKHGWQKWALLLASIALLAVMVSMIRVTP